MLKNVSCFTLARAKIADNHWSTGFRQDMAETVLETVNTEILQDCKRTMLSNEGGKQMKRRVMKTGCASLLAVSMILSQTGAVSAKGNAASTDSQAGRRTGRKLYCGRGGFRQLSEIRKNSW